MKIAIITSGILPVPAVQGGAVENLIDYALEYNNQHHLHDITVYSVFNKKVHQHQALQSQVNHYEYVNTHSLLFRIGAKIYSYFGHHYCYHYQLEYFFERVWQKMKKSRYDLILLENRPGFALQLSERTQTPIISHIHTDLLFEPSPINQSIVSKTMRFLAVSQYIKGEIKKVGVETDIRVVYNGLDSEMFNMDKVRPYSRSDLGFSDSDFIAVFWGRLVPKKGIKELLLAMTKLKEHHDIKLLVIGAINYEDTDQQTNSFIDELKGIASSIPNKVIFTGFVPYERIPSYISMGNVAVVPSCINEALGMTCIEACALGLPVIATNDGGIPETLTGQKHIIINKSKDLPTQLATAIVHIKDNYAEYIGNSLSSKFTKETYCQIIFNSLTAMM